MINDIINFFVNNITEFEEIKACIAKIKILFFNFRTLFIEIKDF